MAIQGGLQPLNAIAQEDINLLIVSPDNKSSYLVVNNITAGGDVSIRAADGITGYDNNALITGDDIIFNTSKGGIGTVEQWVNVNTNDSGGVGGSSLNDVYIANSRGSNVYVHGTSRIRTTKAGSSITITGAKDVDILGSVVAGGEIGANGVTFAGNDSTVVVTAGEQLFLDTGLLASKSVTINGGIAGSDDKL